MSHPYDKTANCACQRCVNERNRRAHQAAESAASAIFKRPIKVPRLKRRIASRADQHGRYLDSGYSNWDDNGRDG